MIQNGLITVNIWGENVQLKTDQDQAFIHDVANYLNEKMKEIQSGGELSTKIVALRTAYIIATEFLMMKNEMSKLECTLKQIEEQFESLQL